MALRRASGMARVGAGIGRIHKADGSPVPGGPLARCPPRSAGHYRLAENLEA
jgi:hypothetical protein